MHTRGEGATETTNHIIVRKTTKSLNKQYQ